MKSKFKHHDITSPEHPGDEFWRKTILERSIPMDWQQENIAASTVAMNEVFSAYEKGVKLDSAFIEQASEKVHIEWLKRNSEWAQENQKLPYAQLIEEEKDKDRLHVLKGIEVFRDILSSVTENPAN